VGLWAKLGLSMELQAGDRVRTESGEEGKVVHTSRLTVFVAFPVHGQADRVEAYLASQLTKIEPDKPESASD
jgi:hypothetical protein